MGCFVLLNLDDRLRPRTGVNGNILLPHLGVARSRIVRLTEEPTEWRGEDIDRRVAVTLGYAGADCGAVEIRVNKPSLSGAPAGALIATVRPEANATYDNTISLLRSALSYRCIRNEVRKLAEDARPARR